MQEHLAQDKQDLEHRDYVQSSFDQIIAEQEKIFAETAQVMSDQSTQVDLLTVKKTSLFRSLNSKKLTTKQRLSLTKKLLPQQKAG